MSQRALDRLKERFGDAVLETSSFRGDETAVVDASRWKEIAEFCRADGQMQFDMLVDLCAVDYPDRLPRLEVVVHLYSIAKRHRLRLKARVGDEDAEGAEIDTLTDVWSGANWFERETFDMFGVKFKGHPDLRRILLYPEFEGHPLLKSYPADKTQPLIPYRTEAEAGVPVDKLAPFRADEGMSFGRKAWSTEKDES
ncbi:MAG: NADH-quinone oxidoreductase subunit C [Myxococcales bacterium]|nr:NADH-quinone oxidoreductase subunit C [Myxococcales bacterium]